MRCGKVDQAAGLIHRFGHWFFDQHVRAMAQKIGGDVVVSRRLRHDADGINLPQQLPVVGQPCNTQLGRYSCACRLVAIDHSQQLSTGQTSVLLRMKAPQVTDADNGSFDVLHLDIMPVVSATQRKTIADSPIGTEFIRLGIGVLVGVLIIPPLIWLAGHLVIGEYIRDPLTGATGGPLALWSDYLQGLAQGSPAHWLAGAGPYGIYVLVRLLRKLLGL